VRDGGFGPRVACMVCRERSLLEELDRD